MSQPEDDLYLSYPEAVVVSPRSVPQYQPIERGADTDDNTNNQQQPHSPSKTIKEKISVFHRLYRSCIDRCFQKEVDDEDREKTTTTRDYFFTALRDVFFSNIPYPATEEFTTNSKFTFSFLFQMTAFFLVERFIIGVISYGIYWAAFIMFFRQTFYDQTENSPYVSTSYNKATCEKVPITVTTSYYLDFDGLWEGKNNFAFYASPFRFQFTEFQVDTQAEFQAMMENYKGTINRIGNYSATQPLAVNLVLWMSYIYYYYVPNPANTSYAALGPDNLQYFEFTGDPSIVFKTAYRQAVASGYKGICNTSALSTSYSQANAQFRVYLKQSTYDTLLQGSDACVTALDRNIFSSSWGNLDTDYNYELDVRTFTTALAVNMGFVELSTLGKAHAEPSYITYGDRSYIVNEYFDTRIRLMEPVLCITDIIWATHRQPATNLTMNDLCFIRYGNTIFLPVLNHIGTSLSTPTQCNCEDSSKTAAACNQLNLILTMLYYPTDETTAFSSYGQEAFGYSKTQLLKLIKLRANYTDYIKFTEATFNASSSSVLSYLGHVPRNDAMGSSWFAGAYDFCKYYNETSGTTEYCAMFSFATIDQQSKRITPYHYELKEGHCANSFSVLTDKEWELTYDPPTQLYEPYYVCVQDYYSAILSAIGLATGNIAVFFLVVFALSVPFVYMYKTCIYEPRQSQPRYPEDQVEAALQNFGTFLCHYATEIHPRPNVHPSIENGDREDDPNDILWKNMRRSDIHTIAKIVDEMDPFLSDPLFEPEEPRKKSMGDKLMDRMEPYCGKMTICRSKNDDEKKGKQNPSSDVESNMPPERPPLHSIMSVNANSKQSNLQQKKGKKKSKKSSE